MIVIVAPYSPPSRGALTHLGAARKIETVIDILSELGAPIVLVNTAHDLAYKAAIDLKQTQISNTSVLELTPPCYSTRKWGKLLNLFDVHKVANAIQNIGTGKPNLVWLYNGYAMESRLGLELLRRFNCFLIQELEDWLFSRSRGFNPKPLVDWWFWRSVVVKASHIFVVNENLANRISQRNNKFSLFPGVVADGITNIRSKRRPFTNITAGRRITIGYFGGLSTEKGANHVLALLDMLSDEFRFIVTGSGPLEAEMLAKASKLPQRFDFRGRVSEHTLNSLISECDVLLNPHSPITDMQDGVFPFKVIEAIASGRLLISTSLPSSGLEEVLQGVCFAGHSTTELAEAVAQSKIWYDQNKERVEAGADEAVRRFSKSAVLLMVKNCLHAET